MTAVELFRAPARQTAALEQVAHRPWPLPEGRWLMGQTWHDLMFAHWRVPDSALRALVPPELTVETYDGDAWLGITPFHITGTRLHGTLPVPGLSAFPELNVRTYVTDGEKPGIWFFSLDAGSAAAVAGARRFYRLPYFRARMSARRRRNGIDYTSVRTEPGAFPRTLRTRYRATGATFTAKPGSLEYFLAERYCLYTLDRGRLYRAEIHHGPWPLQPAEATIDENTMAPRPIELPPDGPLTHFAVRQDVVIWPLQALG
jgi:uncharacterized protein YqjF (DUF2071 family)